MRYFLLVLFLVGSTSAAWAQQTADKQPDLHAQIEALYQQGKFSDIAAIADAAAKKAAELHGRDSLEYASAAIEVADEKNATGDPMGAEPFCREALKIREQRLPADHPDVEHALTVCGNVLQALGKLDESEAFLKRALVLGEKHAPDEHLADTLQAMAMVDSAQAKYADSEKLYQRAIVIRKKAAPESVELGAALSNLGDLYRMEGRYPEADATGHMALQMRLNILPPVHVDLADSFNNVALVERIMGHFEDSEKHYKRAIEIIQKTLGEENQYFCAVISNLGDLYEVRGKYAEAEAAYKRAIAMKEKVSGPDSLDVSITVFELGRLYFEEGNAIASESYLKRSLAIEEKNVGKEHPDLAPVLTSLAQIYNARRKYPEAQSALLRAIALWEKAIGKDYAEIGVAQGALAQSYTEQGRYDEAEKYFTQSIRILDKSFGHNSRDVAVSLQGLGVANYRQENYPTAQDFFLQTLAIQQKIFPPDHRETGVTLQNLATLNYSMDRRATAGDYFERAMQNLSNRFDHHFSAMSEKERLRYLDSSTAIIDQYDSFCLKYHEQDPALAGKMYDLALWRKGLVANGISALYRRLEASPDPKTKELMAQLRSVRGSVAKLMNSPGPDRVKWLHEVADLESKGNEIERQLADSAPALAQENRLEHATWRDIQKSLRPGEAAVEIVRFSNLPPSPREKPVNYYVALVLRSSKFPKIVVLGKAAELEKAPLAEYRERVSPSPGRSAPTGATFYQAFWKPLEADLHSATRVYLAPDGALHQVSWSAVQDSTHHSILQGRELYLLSNTKDLLRPSTHTSNSTAVLLGNPEFSLSSTQYQAAIQNAKEPVLVAAAADPGELVRGYQQGGALTPLPGTQREVEQIDSLLRQGSWHTSVLTGSSAIEESVKKVVHPRILHLATHGYFLPDRHSVSEETGATDPMLRSGLFLAGADATLQHNAGPADAEDAILTASEAMGLDLQGTELVVLSACETGLGKVEAGEGVFGLRRAFQVAGANTVLMSLWSVPDRETQELMTLFYGRWLATGNKHRGLREAQLTMRSRVRARYGRDLPYYWAGFVLVGRE